MSDQRELRIFIVNAHDKAGLFAQSFHDTYGDRYNFSDVEFTTTLHKAIQSLDEAEYDLCVISDTFPLEELQAFFDDFGKVNQSGSCIFVYVWQTQVEDFDPGSFKKLGFHGVLSAQGSHTDREELHEALKDWRYEEEINQRSIDVDSALNVILRQLDRVARDIKRGIKNKFDKIPTEFVHLQTDYDEEILTRYYQKLEQKTSEAEPENAKGIQVPQSVLKRQLPHLKANTYTGASQRVWKKLLRKLGTDKAPVEPKDTEPPLEQAQEEVTDETSLSSEHQE